MPSLIQAEQIFYYLEKIRKNSPLILNITNFVAMNFSANALLACGASPVMSQDAEEFSDLLRISAALVLNMGTLDKTWIHSAKFALKEASQFKIPVVFDPVGSGASLLRTKTARFLLEKNKISVLRGNASEILSFMDNKIESKGVDSLHSSEEAVDAAKALSREHNIVVCVSGKTDHVVDHDNVVKIHNGSPLMAKITAMGCVASTLIGGFLAVEKNNFLGTISAMVVMGICGELAEKKCSGPGSFQVDFLDALYHLSLPQVKNYLRVESP